MTFNVLTLFPDVVTAYLNSGVVGRGLEKGLLELNISNPRDFTKDVHKSVDDRPFGGGDGMLMMAQPLEKALSSIKSPGRVIYMSPTGVRWTSQRAQDWAHKGDPITLISGRYAGVDQRFINKYVDEQVSLGDFVISGGELAVMSIIDSVSRFIPGVLGNSLSAIDESFQHRGLLECPQFTRPREVFNQSVPGVLLSGDPKKITAFKTSVSVVITALFRGDLLKDFTSLELKSCFEEVLNLPDQEMQSLGLTREQILKGQKNV